MSGKLEKKLFKISECDLNKTKNCRENKKICGKL